MQQFSLLHYVLAWSVHLFTASGAFIGVLSLMAIYQHNYILAFWLMGVTVAIDSIDGTLARLCKVKTVLPNIDGTLLDNIIDYTNYVIVPVFFILVKPDMLPSYGNYVIALLVAVTSCYQFCQQGAKTPDHFFKGFPCYWNFAVFYMFIFNTSASTNISILFILCVLIFVPIKYVYPSRLDYLTPSKTLKLLMHVFSLVFAISYCCILLAYPEKHQVWLGISLGYIMLYLVLSVYRTYYPASIVC